MAAETWSLKGETKMAESTKYMIFVRAEDGRHELIDKPVIYDRAKSVSDQWLGGMGTWQGNYRAISMFGSVLTIEEVDEHDAHFEDQ